MTLLPSLLPNARLPLTGCNPSPPPPPPCAQGVAGLGLGPAGLTALLTDLCNLAAFDSLVAGLMPALERRALDNLLASFG